FLHIPWPARRLFDTLPNHRELMQSLFDYDLVGFQSEDSLGAFQDYVVQQEGGSIGPGTATAFGRTIKLGAYPIGLDADAFIAAAEGEVARGWRERMEASLTGRRMIVGVDRLDYSKGLEERFLAYE